MEASTRERGRSTTKLQDEHPGLVWFAEQCQANNVRFDGLIRRAETARDPDLAAFFRRAKAVGQALESMVPHR